MRNDHFKTKKHKKRYVDSSSLALVLCSWNCVWFLCSFEITELMIIALNKYFESILLAMLKLFLFTDVAKNVFSSSNLIAFL